MQRRPLAELVLALVLAALPGAAPARAQAPPARAPRQEPSPPFPYGVEEVTVENAEAGVRLAGTLTRPRGPGPVPAAVLVSGSGPQDRDGELLGHRPFLVLADDLTRRGLVVLRCDARGVGGSTGSFMGSTTQDFAGDCLAEVQFLQSRPEVDRARIGLVGHGEGGLAASLVAAGSRDLAFVVLLATPGLPGDEVLLLQGDRVLAGLGESDSVVAWNHRVQERLFAAARAGGDSSAVRARLLAVVATARDSMPGEIRERLDAADLAGQAETMASPWFRFFLDYDPAPALRLVRCPVLALGGELDQQVPPAVNLPAIARALRAGGNRDFETRELPRLNHLFQTCTTGSILEYGTGTESFAPAALDTLGAWIGARVGAAGR